MGIGIYKAANSSTGLSSGDLSSPFAITFDGRTGGFKETKLYVRNDDATKYYTGLELSLTDATDRNITVNTADGFVWKLSAGDTKPTFNDWLNTAPGNSISLNDIGSSGSPDTSTYLPFWVFIQVPEGLDIQLFTGVSFTLSGEENLV